MNILTGVALYLLQPLLDVVEGLRVGNIVNDNDTVGASVVRGSDSSESFLTGCVPNLKLRKG